MAALFMFQTLVREPYRVSPSATAARLRRFQANNGALTGLGTAGGLPAAAGLNGIAAN
jgi:hypothetical protein